MELPLIGGAVPLMGGVVPLMGGAVPLMGGAVPLMGGAVPLIPLYTIMTLTEKILPYFSCPAFYASIFIFSVFDLQMYSAWCRAKCHIP